MAVDQGVVARLCDHCEHAAFGSGGVYCTLFQEDIWDSKVAAECAEFDPVPWAPEGAKGDHPCSSTASP